MLEELEGELEINFNDLSFEEQMDMVVCIDRINMAPNECAELAAKDAFDVLTRSIYEKYHSNGCDCECA